MKIKSRYMKNKSTQQEILIMLGTGLSKLVGSLKDISHHNKPATESEMLEEACWNGLLCDMLPEIWEHVQSSDHIFIWQVRKAESFIEMEIGNEPMQFKENNYCIDPYAFVPTLINN